MIRRVASQGLHALLLWSIATAAQSAFHFWRISEVFSNADGSMQFVELREIAGANGEDLLQGHSLVSAQGASTRSLVFPANLPSAQTAGRRFLIGTARIAARSGVTPDYVMPEGFLFINNGSLDYAEGTDRLSWTTLPTDGVRSLLPDGTTAANSPTNFAGATGSIAPAPALATAVLPVSRAVMVNRPATAFATLINPGPTAAQGCGIGLPTGIPATFSYQTTDPLTNEVTGTSDTRVAIGAGASQTFVFSVTPVAPFAETDIALVFSCTSGQSSTPIAGVNTLLLTSSQQPTPDVIALALTQSNDGIVRTGLTTGTAFSLAAVNVGIAGPVVASVEGSGAARNSIALSICRTDASAACLAPPQPSVSTPLAATEAATFSVFASGTGTAVALDPATSRVFVRFRLANGASVGATSVAVTTQASASNTGPPPDPVPPTNPAPVPPDPAPIPFPYGAP